MDRRYMDFKRMELIARAGAFFLTRAKDNLRFSRQRSQPVDMRTGLRSDQVGKPTLPKARSDFPSLLRKVRYYDEETNRDFVFLTNNLNVSALSVPKIGQGAVNLFEPARPSRALGRWSRRLIGTLRRRVTTDHSRDEWAGGSVNFVFAGYFFQVQQS